jgi:isopentenyl-diphosphate delta-isomerase
MKMHERLVLQRLGRSIGTISKPAIDPVQEALLAEPCILVDEHDRAVGQASKRDCHRMVDGSSLLHRAFSLFIFNNNGDLLLQKRSSTKITFPNMWTNTCCSHPLVLGEEVEEKDAWGVRLAAQRKVNSELGIPVNQVEPENIQYLTRILYSAPSSGEWGEHELDYILLLRGDVTTQPNPDEVSEIEWVSRPHLPEFMKHVETSGGQITPWFRLITQNLLPVWWKNLDRIDQHTDHATIHKFT